MKDKILEKFASMVDEITNDIINTEFNKMEEGERKKILTDLFVFDERIEMVMAEPLREGDDPDEKLKDKIDYLATVGLVLAKLNEKVSKYTKEHIKERLDKKSLGEGYSSWTNLIVKL